jgi:hypothetical protein
MSYLLHPSGSLPYHLRAWRWRRTLWAPFHAEVGNWLSDWRPNTGHLVLIGPSGGYALNGQFLARFADIAMLEPDPLALWLMRRRFPGIRVHWNDSTYLAQPGGFFRLAETYPNAALLFCNLLGQELQGEPATFDRAAWLTELEQALAGRDWASWHDLVSSARRPDSSPLPRFDHAIPLDDLLAMFWHGGNLEITDHDTAKLCPDLPRRCCVWHLAPNRYHLIEWLWHGARQPGT